MNRLQKAIQFVETEKGEKVFSIRPIEGHANDLFFVNLKYIVRLGVLNNIDAPFLADYCEYHLYKQIIEKRLDAPFPPLMLYAPADRDKWELYMDGEEPFTKKDRLTEDAFLVVDSIAQMHSLEVDLPSFNTFSRFNLYKKASGKKLPVSFERQIIANVERIIDSRKPVCCHHQLAADNIILSNQKAILLDLEFVGMNASIFDIASLAEENGFPSALSRQCLTRYSTLTLENAYTFEELNSVIIFLDAFWYYWNMARYNETGQDKYSKAAEEKKKRFLFAFNGKLMEDNE
ncbi:MAG: phosphotransferase [Bacilli bacterium]|nr:phosphotransferase [Bacilli bacterium]